MRVSTLHTAIAAALLMSACAPRIEPSAPAPARGVPGFDTRDYPGDAAMRAWFGASPYRWVGYYLPAPCYKGVGWAGRRAALHDIGWGFAVLFVGEQDWRAMPGAAADTIASADERCSSSHLTQAEGGADAQRASAAAAADGFPDGTVIFLDVERVSGVSPELEAYIRSWVSSLLEAGRYTPGLYAHHMNVEEVYAVVAAEFVQNRRTDRPPLWVARPGDFDLRSAPAESGYAAALIWQGILNAREVWNGTALNIDANVSSSADPSRGR